MMSCLINTQLDLKAPTLSQKLIPTSYCSRHLEKQAESREVRPGGGAGTLTGEQDTVLRLGCVTKHLESCLNMLYPGATHRNPALMGPRCGLGTRVFKPPHPGDSPAGLRTGSLGGTVVRARSPTHGSPQPEGPPSGEGPSPLLPS